MLPEFSGAVAGMAERNLLTKVPSGVPRRAVLCPRLGKRCRLRFALPMQRILLESETDWQDWRNATRALVLAGVPPEEVQWAVRAHPDERSSQLPEGSAGFNLPRALVAIAALAFQARDPERFALLYRLVWRANAGEKVLEKTSDPDLRRAQSLAYAVRAEAHKMRTNVRFLPVEEDRYLGWYVPAHYVLEANAQLMAQRFPDVTFSILTPDGSAHWQAGTLRFGAGLAHVADDAALEKWWEANRVKLMRETHSGTSIPQAEPLDESPRAPDRPPIGPVVLPQRADAQLLDATHEAADCRRCHLFELATQTVFGEGPADAAAMFIGEQPGDQEDVIGRPFVGPAGQIMDRAMEEAGIDRRTVYITNAVKHFKFTPRGKRRIHQTPESPEIQACRFWLDVERVQLRPSLLVLMGGTAARAVMGRQVTITRERGRPIKMADGQTAFVTVHPSFLLRVPDEDAKAREYRAFVRDLEAVRKLLATL
ncbi:MAG TPA: UdgX family uracil-DNA binding protein [Acetobacteraceae bacterium]|nr:UdgX family uracil-DNA binding protein [Acetobacteraceae bacterium]